MFVRYLIVLHVIFAMVFGVPLFHSRTYQSSEEDEDGLPKVLPPESIRSDINYETLGGGFEGDMIFPAGFDPTDPSTARGVLAAGIRRWPNNELIYDLSAISTSSDRDFIKQAMNTLMYAVGTPIQGSQNRRACVWLREKTSSDSNYLRVVYGGGCSCHVGYWPGFAMTLTLAKPGCFYSGIIQHELMHSLGFFHEQSRPDRDNHVTVNLGNVQSGAEHNFEKYAWGSTVVNQGFSYDYGSLMHYGRNDFSRNGQPTIVPKQSGATIGQRDRLSAIDIAEIRNYYGC